MAPAQVARVNGAGKVKTGSAVAPVDHKQQQQQRPAKEAAGDAVATAPRSNNAQPQEPRPSAASLGELYSKCVQMVNENKISNKNAFDLKLIDHMDDIVDSFMGGAKRKAAERGSSGRPSVVSTQARPLRDAAAEIDEHRFLEASCTIEASARIYACRVDCVHTDTYRVLGGLSSADMDEEEAKDGEDGGKAAKKRRIIGVNTLEKHERNIVQQTIEADEQSDPMFRRMAAAFDAGGAKGLLLSNLPIVEDLSLVFNGDVPISRAATMGKPMFEKTSWVSANKLGLGPPEAAADKVAASKLCPDVDQFRRQLFGGSSDLTLPESLARLLTPCVAKVGLGGEVRGSAAIVPDASTCLDMQPLQDADFGGQALDDVNFGDDFGTIEAGDIPPLPSADVSRPLHGAVQEVKAQDTGVIEFDKLFERFCSGAAGNQFAYFDDCWSRAGRGVEMGVLTDGQVDQTSDIVASAIGIDGALVAATDGASARGRQPKKPLFDLSGLERPLRPIETEPVHKHQLSERAAQWQLHKDVPPYMIDRITMPSWPSWSKCDFACLGLRPHLMLKLEKKTPSGPGPHSFSDQFATVIVENPDAFPWQSTSGRGFRLSADGGDGDDFRRNQFDMNDDGDDDFDGSGLPAHLDVDPQDLFLQPDDKVIPGCDQDDFAGGEDGEEGRAYELGVDFDLVDQPNKCGSDNIGYSRNSKFVDVKLVKKHLLDCVNNDIEMVKAEDPNGQAAISFQALVYRTVQRMPKSEIENLSIQVCFICALHLCNEKGLELLTDPSKPLMDFQVIGPPALTAAANGK